MLLLKSVSTFSVRSSAPLIIVASSCVSSPPLPAFDDQHNEDNRDKTILKILSLEIQNLSLHGSKLEYCH